MKGKVENKMEFQPYILALSALGVLHAFEPGHGKTAIAMFSVTENFKTKHIFSIVTGVFLPLPNVNWSRLLLNTVFKGNQGRFCFSFISHGFWNIILYWI